MNWLIFALLSSIMAALVAIFGKMGLRGVDSTLATTIRAVIMAIFLILVSAAGFLLKKFDTFSLKSFGSKDWLLIILAGLAGALSWLFYFFALKNGLATNVVVIDRLSLIFVIILAAVFLGERLSWGTAIGALLMVVGAIIVVFK